MRLPDPFTGWTGGARLKANGAHAQSLDKPEEELVSISSEPELVRAHARSHTLAHAHAHTLDPRQAVSSSPMSFAASPRSFQ